MLKNHPVKVSGELSAFANAAQSIAEDLESGQAGCPLTDGFHRLGSPSDEQTITVLLLGLSPAATSAALSRLLNEEFNICRVVVPSRLGYTEVYLQERGFSLETGLERREFDDVDTFIDALKAADLVQEGNPDSWMDPLRLQLKAPESMRGLRLLIPDSLDSLQKKPALLSTLADQSDWVLLVGSRSEIITDGQRSVLQLLFDQVVGLQCLETQSESGQSDKNDRPWWKDWTVALSLGLLSLESEETQGRLEMLTSSASSLRRWVLENRRHISIGSHLMMLDDSIEQQLKQLNNRRKLQGEVVLPARAEDRAGSHSKNDVQQSLRDDLDSLKRSIEDSSKRSLLPDGEIARLLEQTANDIDEADIEQVETQSNVRLSLAGDALQRCRDRIREIGRTKFREDFSMVQETLENSSSTAGNRLSDQLGATKRLSFSMPDFEALWRNIEAIASPQIKYKGEMPLPTLGSRLSAARQVTMPLMIVGMMLGGVATVMGGSRGSVGPLMYTIMLPLFVFAFFYTYVSFRKKEELLLEKETEKLREGVLSELKRNLTELFREEQAALNKELAKVLRELETQVQNAMDQHAQRNKDTQAASQQKATQNVRTIDQRISHWQTQQRELQTLSRKKEAIGKSLTLWLGDWINAFNSGTL